MSFCLGGVTADLAGILTVNPQANLEQYNLAFDFFTSSRHTAQGGAEQRPGHVYISLKYI